MLTDCVSHSLPPHRRAGLARRPFRSLQGPRDHRAPPPARRPPPPEPKTRPLRTRPDLVTTSPLPRCGAPSNPPGSTQPQIDLKSLGRSSSTPRPPSLAISSRSTQLCSAATTSCSSSTCRPAKCSTPLANAFAERWIGSKSAGSSPSPSREINPVRRPHPRVPKGGLTSHDAIFGPHRRVVP